MAELARSPWSFMHSGSHGFSCRSRCRTIRDTDARYDPPVSPANAHTREKRSATRFGRLPPCRLGTASKRRSSPCRASADAARPSEIRIDAPVGPACACGGMKHWHGAGNVSKAGRCRRVRPRGCAPKAASRRLAVHRRRDPALRPVCRIAHGDHSELARSRGWGVCDDAARNGGAGMDVRSTGVRERRPSPALRRLCGRARRSRAHRLHVAPAQCAVRRNIAVSYPSERTRSTSAAARSADGFASRVRIHRNRPEGSPTIDHE